MTDFLVLKPCRMACLFRRSIVTCCLNLLCDWISSPWRWVQQVITKRRNKRAVPQGLRIKIPSFKLQKLLEWVSSRLFSVNLSYRIVSNYQLNAQFLYSITIYYIIILNMFRAVLCSSLGGQIVLLQPLVSSLSVNGRTVCRLRADCSPLSTGILYCKESDDTRGCNNTICPPKDEHSTARNMLRITM